MPQAAKLPPFASEETRLAAQQRDSSTASKRVNKFPIRSKRVEVEGESGGPAPPTYQSTAPLFTLDEISRDIT